MYLGLGVLEVRGVFLRVGGLFGLKRYLLFDFFMGFLGVCWRVFGVFGEVSLVRVLGYFGVMCWRVYCWRRGGLWGISFMDVANGGIC